MNLTIVVPAYNRPKLLQRLLKSLLIGVHFSQRTNLFRRPLLQQPRPYHFKSSGSAHVVYDAFQELQSNQLAATCYARQYPFSRHPLFV